MLIQVFIFSSIVYPMVGFQLTITKFFWFVLYMILSFTDYTLYGMMAVALTPNIEIAAGLSFLIFMIWNVFSGFIVARKVIFFSFFSPLSSVCIRSTHTSGQYNRCSYYATEHCTCI